MVALTAVRAPPPPKVAVGPSRYSQLYEEQPDKWIYQYCSVLPLIFSVS